MQPVLAIRRAFLTSSIIALALLVSLVGATPVARAGGGNVLPPNARPKGYSLVDAAAATAYFNMGTRTLDTLPQGFPFQILYLMPSGSTTFTVKPGTSLYVPVVYSDDAEPILGDFPDVTDQGAVADYYFSSHQLGAQYIELVVDGETTSLAQAYVAGAETPGLPDSGNNYTVAAAFLTPLTKGTHTVTIQGRLTGDAIAAYPEYFPEGVYAFQTTYTVRVK